MTLPLAVHHWRSRAEALAGAAAPVLPPPAHRALDRSATGGTDTETAAAPIATPPPDIAGGCRSRRTLECRQQHILPPSRRSPLDRAEPTAPRSDVSHRAELFSR